MVDLESLVTESPNPATSDLDTMSPLEVARAMNREDREVARAVGEVLDRVAQAIAWGRDALAAQGRIVYVGAGTSGRLGVLDAVECRPTFGVPDGVVVGLIAGGAPAFTQAVEGAEDDEGLGVSDIDGLSVGASDMVVGLAASGRTPYVAGALRRARERGARTVAVACTRPSLIGTMAGLAIEVSCGPEVLTGSTRLKAGTAQKMILNMISTGSMVGTGKAFGNLMVDVQPTNEKLRARALSIVEQACGTDASRAEAALEDAGGMAKPAIVSILADVDAKTADTLLAQASGDVRRAIALAQDTRQEQEMR
ncbi:N-acetylmuramic acid 6-phosphate etherase [Granulimonas faecalis]|uniref:N-acetylmuramic acid 6-phosphate etherase n=1 Tax=Granulimonas faecalis TaxID=2894155 RepID=A0AAV5B2L5_9ACTN|nr:N-acetylmuramic acid 6-phosphate etherase [Granulimonas faecalis]GJM54866.1 N-acetylmuramic acid 6-phosphate etherase [Granulimonas faecalis]